MPRSRQANNKTQAHDGSVDAFIATVEPAGRKEDAYALLALMQEVTGETPRMRGPSIVGFGQFKTGSSCLYLGRLQNVDLKVLRRLVDKSVKYMRSKYA